MQLVNCPTEINDISDDDFRSPLLFLGGGITNCPDWQQDMINRLHNVDDVILVNPRRADFDVTDPMATDFQIKWERRYLDCVDCVMFWFPEETLCPITLFELGVALMTDDQIIVGCHPNYARKDDVRIQLSLIRPEIVVQDSLDKVEFEIRKWVKSYE